MNILILLLTSLGLCYGINLCPGGHYKCEDKQTCCQLPNGEYGCCPFPEATCCKDHTHCCPNGMKCDLPTQSCKKGNFGVSVPMKVHEPAQRVESSKDELRTKTGRDDDKCPDGKPCSADYTCCPLKKGGFGCCALKDAICCTDSIHCCPQGYTCNTTLGTCDKVKLQPRLDSPGSSENSKQPIMLSEVKVTAVTELPASKQKETIKCPDPEYECEDADTCCKAAAGGYGCCPMSQATCCKDGVHCCPHGYKCVKLGCLPEKSNVAYNPFFN